MAQKKWNNLKIYNFVKGRFIGKKGLIWLTSWVSGYSSDAVLAKKRKVLCTCTNLISFNTKGITIN
jgi:hypothetical protein